MIEIFPDISDEAREQAELAWIIASRCKTPVAAAKMLDAFTNYYCTLSNEENIREFLNFFFNMKLEELKANEDDTNIG